MIEVLAGEPIVTKGSVRVLLDPSKATMHPGWIYEFVYHMPSWVPDFVSDAIGRIIKWWRENVDGLEIISFYREKEYDRLVFQAKVKSEVRVAGKYYPLGIPGIALPIIIGLAAVLVILGIIFIAFGLRLAGTGMVLLGLSIIIFLLAHGYYKLLAMIPAAGGLYLIAKQAGAV